MSLSGTFSTMPFPDLLQWLSDSRRSGSLSVSLEFEERFLQFKEGNITVVESDQPRAPAATPQPETPEDHQRHAVQAVLGLFLWRDGRFHFSEGAAGVLDARRATPLQQPISTREILMEGMRRLDEWQRIVEVFPSDFCMVHALGRDDRLPILAELLARGEPVALGELWAVRGADRYKVYEQLFQAVQKGLLAVDAQPIAPVMPNEQSPVDALVRNAAILVDEHQYEEAATLLRAALDLDPFRDDARALLRRAGGEQLADLYQVIPPYKVPVLTVPRERLGRLNLTPREQHIAARINGRWDVGALAVLTPLGELETMRVVKKLLHMGAARLQD
jgi:Domain of unknown function (DUF4388)